jgi:hypothetical protein
MINLSIAMKAICILLLVFTYMLLPQSVQAQEGALPVISTPSQGQIVQGLVVITGTVSALGFSSYELSFAYADDSTQTWFVLTSGSEPIFEGELGTWDTTTLTDGDYSLRLRTFMLDGTIQETTVTGLRVRNYTPVPTSTFTPTATAVVQFAPPTAQLVAPAPDTATPSLPTPTPLPPNPASLQEATISRALGRGVILALVLFLGFGLLLRQRRE